MTTLVRKRCARCKWSGKVPPHAAHCLQPRFGKGSYACWGDLAVVVRKRKPPPVPTPAGLGVPGWHLGDEAAALARGTVRAEAAAKCRRAEKRIGAMNLEMARIVKRIHALRLQVARWSVTASMTDAELDARKRRRSEAYLKGRQARAPRAVKIGGLQ